MIHFQVKDPKNWLVEVCCLECNQLVHVHMDQVPIAGHQFGDPSDYVIYWFRFYCGKCKAVFIDVSQTRPNEEIAQVEYIKTPDELFHEHLDACEQCMNNPFDLCSEGDKLLRATGPRAGGLRGTI